MKIVTGKSLCGLFRSKGSFFSLGYVPSKNYFWTVSEIMKADLKQPQTSTRTSRASNKQADGIWWLWIEFFPCLPFIHGRSGEAIETGFRRATLRQRSWSGRERATTHKKWKKGCGVISWTRKPDEPDNFYHCAKALKKMCQWKVKAFLKGKKGRFFCLVNVWREKFYAPWRFLCPQKRHSVKPFFYRVNLSLGSPQRL